MPRRRLALIGALLLVPLIGFVVARFALSAGDDGENIAADRTTTSTTEAEATTTTESTTTLPPTTTTTLPPGNPATSPLPSIPRPGEPVAASDPDALAAQIRTAEAAIADPATPPDELRRQAHIQQVAYRKLASDAAVREAVLPRLSTELRVVAETNLTANMKLRALIKEPKTSLPPWRIVPPAPPDELLGYYKEAEADLGVPWYYLASIHLVETRMGRIRGNSDANAQGPMQFLPSTWEQYGNGGDIQSNKDAIAAAARYLKRNGAPNDMRNALFNYNRDVRYVDAVLAFGDRMRADERAYYGYHQWQVYYVTTVGDVWLPEGYVAS